jgi:putative ABC transport system permease protein
VWAFGIVGALVLVIACINYVNLTTAQVAERMRGVGLRKTFGASRRQVAVHVLAESLLVTGLAVAVGVLMAWLALPSLNRLAPDPVSLSALWGPAGALLLLSVTATTAVLASAYPAAYLSSLRPIQLFRGGVGAGRTSALRRVLVVTQFAVAIGLTAVTVIVVQQTRYLADKNLGLDRAHTLIVSTRLVDAPREARGQQLGVVEERLRRQQGVRATGRMAMRPNIDGKLFTDDLVVPGQAGDGQAGDTVAVEPLIGSEGMTRALGIPLQAGQRLDEAPEGILINRAAAERLGEAAQVGAPLRLVNRYRRLDTTTVVAGILDDFHYRSLRSPIVPTYFRVDDAWQINSNLFVRAEPGQARSVLSATREAWNDVMPAGTFEYTFMNDEFAQMHRADTQQRNLLLVLAGLALLVACLGLIGLVAYLADRRRAEIGVRKTLGASVASIVGLLSREVVAGLAVAFLVAVPLAYVAASAWLEQFAYRIDMGPVAFGAAGVIVGAFALGAAASQAYRAAQVDPAVAVRGD